MKYSIVIPCFNEEKNIPLLVEKSLLVLESNSDLEIILVNNGSLDNSLEELRRLENSHEHLKVVSIDTNEGYGNGILVGLEAAAGQYLGWTHADLQTDPMDITRAIELLDNNEREVLIKGFRHKRPLKDLILSFGMAIIEMFLFKTFLWEINAQPTIFSRDLYESWKNPPKDFSLDLYAYVMAKKQSFTLKRVDVFFPDRIHGESSWNTSFRSKWKVIKRTLIFSWKLMGELGRDKNRSSN